MTFAPLRDEHAIEEVGFALIFDQPFDQNRLMALRQRHSEIRQSLPAMSMTEENGLMFGYLRPNGSPIWSMRFDENAAFVECTRYSRWDRVWTQAREFLMFGLREAGDMQLAAIGLVVKDQFRSAEDAFELQNLFKPSDVLPRSIFNQNPPWFCNQQWAQTGSQGLLITTLELMARPRVVRKSGEATKIVAVTIEHQQQLQFETPLDSASALDNLEDQIDSGMSEMHQLNKRALDDLLVVDQQEKIGLWKA